LAPLCWFTCIPRKLAPVSFVSLRADVSSTVVLFIKACSTAQQAESQVSGQPTFFGCEGCVWCLLSGHRTPTPEVLLLLFLPSHFFIVTLSFFDPFCCFHCLVCSRLQEGGKSIHKPIVVCLGCICLSVLSPTIPACAPKEVESRTSINRSTQPVRLSDVKERERE
jgi:hypothetical protein